MTLTSLFSNRKLNCSLFPDDFIHFSCSNLCSFHSFVWNVCTVFFPWPSYVSSQCLGFSFSPLKSLQRTILPGFSPRDEPIYTHTIKARNMPLFLYSRNTYILMASIIIHANFLFIFLPWFSNSLRTMTIQFVPSARSRDSM